MKGKRILKAIIFSLLFIIVFVTISQIFTISSSDTEYQWMSGIYHQREDSLDAVYLGSSNCYAFWNANFAWNEYGITVYPYACSNQPFIITKYLIKEARKTQPNALYIVNINTLGDESIDETILHHVIDYMPFSWNRIQLTNYLCNFAQLSFLDRIEYLLPIIRYHDKWNELTVSNFTVNYTDVKGANTYPWYMYYINDISKEYLYLDKTTILSDRLLNSIDDLLDYCENENINILFVTAPRAEESEKKIKKINTVKNLLISRGYTVLDYLSNPDELNLDLSTDYYDNTHTNVHGSLKFTHYISEYLVNNYELVDKRDDPNYEDWNIAYENYSSLLTEYLLDFELDFEHRDFNMPAPQNLNATSKGYLNYITWDSVDEADGYFLFKRVSDEGFVEINKSASTFYFDSEILKDKSYAYIVVPYKEIDGEIIYGNYQYNGVWANEG